MVGQAPAFAPAASAPPRGLSLERLLELAPLTPEQGVAVGAAVLHRLAVSAPAPDPAALVPRNIRILPDGGVAFGERASPDVDEREVLKAAGRLACSALGVDVEPDPGLSFSAAESVALPVVVLSRAMAVGALGSDLGEAERLFLERAGRFGSPERLQCSREELGALVARLLQTASVAARPVAPGERPRARFHGLPLVAASSLVLLLAGLAALLSTGVTTPRPAPARSSPALSALSPAIQPSPVEVALPQPHEVPAYAPAAAGAVRSVQVQLAGPCSAGATCALQVAVSFRPGSGPTAIAWKLEVFDRCTGNTVERPGQGFIAPAGWNHVLVASAVQLPPARGAALVVVTTAPALAASAPLAPAGLGC
jgi:hypothetical protein